MADTGRWMLVIITGGVVALAIAGLAAWRTHQDPTLTFVVFALVTAPTTLGAARVLLPGGDDRRPEHHEETVEHDWITRATSSAFLDLVIALGLATALGSVLDVETLPIIVFLVLAMVDAALRYFAISRQPA